MSHWIVKYDDKLKACFHLKTKPEPWMHLVASMTEADGGTMQVLVAVYVWDTRTIIESQQHKELAGILSKQIACLKAAAKPADSRVALNGPGSSALNAELHWKQAANESWSNAYSSPYLIFVNDKGLKLFDLLKYDKAKDGNKPHNLAYKSDDSHAVQDVIKQCPALASAKINYDEYDGAYFVVKKKADADAILSFAKAKKVQAWLGGER